MDRVPVAPRDDWQATAESLGFRFHTMYGKPYWVEDACYTFTLRQIEDDLEAPTGELMELCYQFVDRAVRDEEVLRSLRIPQEWWYTVCDSWLRGDKDIYARFDLSYDGRSPARMLEINADTPTALYEASFFQWIWLEQAMERGLIPAGSDQFNSIQEALIDAFASLGRGYGPAAGPMLGGRLLHLSGCRDSQEDLGTVQYMRDCAHQAGLATALLAIEDIGVDAHGRLTDLEDRVIEVLFKLYPWEFLIQDPFGVHLRGPNAPQMVEPAWKMLLSNKGVLPWLWRMFPGHPNLLPAWFADDPAASALGSRHVRKPLLSREGANITLVDPALPGGAMAIEGPYGAEGYIVQEYHPLPVFVGADGAANHAVVGSWIVAGRPCGIGMREDDGPITVDTSRFLPHVITG